jgi:hypothetical protein
MPKYKPDKNCVLYLEGQQDPYSSTIKDLSGFGNHGTITGTKPYWTQTNKGLVVNTFNDSDIVILASHSASLNITGDLTIECWVKRDSTDVSYGLMIIKGPEASTPYEILWNDMGTNPAQFIYIHQKVGGGTQAVTSSSNWTNDVWWHLRFVRDLDGNINIFRNDVADIVAVATDGVPLGTDTNQLYIGMRSDGHYFKGQIGLLRLANYIAPSHFQQERYLFGV